MNLSTALQRVFMETLRQSAITPGHDIGARPMTSLDACCRSLFTPAVLVVDVTTCAVRVSELTEMPKRPLISPRTGHHKRCQNLCNAGVIPMTAQQGAPDLRMRGNP